MVVQIIMQHLHLINLVHGELVLLLVITSYLWVNIKVFKLMLKLA